MAHWFNGIKHSGHGWVFPRPAGQPTEPCGGPMICTACANDLRLLAKTQAASAAIQTNSTAGFIVADLERAR